MDPQDFKNALGSFASGVTVITTQTPYGEDVGMTASAFSSLSLDPPLVLVCVAHKAATHAFLAKASHFGVSILGSNQQERSNRFAGYPPMDDRFHDFEVARSPSGMAWIPGALAHLDCRRHNMLDGGDHTIFVGRVETAVTAADADAPLVYWRGGYR